MARYKVLGVCGGSEEPEDGEGKDEVRLPDRLCPPPRNIIRSGGRLQKFRLVIREPRAARFGGLRGGEKEEIFVKKCISCQCQGNGKDADHACCGEEPQPPVCAHEPLEPRRPEDIRPVVKIIGPTEHDSHP